MRWAWLCCWARRLALIFTIDRTLNNIWRVRTPRPLGQRVLIYWAALTLGPLLLGVSLSLTSLAVSSSKGLVGALPGGVSLLLEVLQFALVGGGMATMFRYVPNTHVRWGHAWMGGLFVATGIEVAKRGLTLYLSSVPTYSAVYGAFATVPILLIWIYTAWVIVLLGAALTAYVPSLIAGIPRRRVGPGLAVSAGVRSAAAVGGSAAPAQQRPDGKPTVYGVANRCPEPGARAGCTDCAGLGRPTSGG